MNDLRKQPESYWKEKLTPEQYKVCRLKGTERAFTGALYNNHEKGMYVCVACEQPLFSSDTKFDSGTGWPSFYMPVAENRIIKDSDFALGIERTEVECARCGGHLGHVQPQRPIIADSRR